VTTSLPSRVLKKVKNSIVRCLPPYSLRLSVNQIKYKAYERLKIFLDVLFSSLPVLLREDLYNFLYPDHCMDSVQLDAFEVDTACHLPSLSRREKECFSHEKTSGIISHGFGRM
jgi:hypothetical protein